MFDLSNTCLLCNKPVSTKRPHWCSERLEFVILSCISTTTQSHIHTSRLNSILNDKDGIMWMARTRSAREVHALNKKYIDIEPELPDPRRYIAYVNEAGMMRVNDLKRVMRNNITVIAKTNTINIEKETKKLQKDIKLFEKNVSKLINKYIHKLVQ